MRLILFRAERLAVWFAQAEAQFTLAGISGEKTTICYVISQLDHQYATEVMDIITSPAFERAMHLPAPYAQEDSDHKPSQFLRHLRNLALDMPATFSTASDLVGYAHILCIILIGQPEGNLNSTACCVDRITEVAPQPALANIPLSDSPSLLQCIEDVSHQVAVLTAERPRSSFRDSCPSSRNHHPGSRLPFQDDMHPPSAGTIVAMEPGVQKYTHPCAYRQQGR